MLFKINATKQLALSVCIALALCSTGCRSSRLGGGNLFGFNSKPSAEALAGNGPTVTYPAPPSESATPEAIASLAGGTVASSNQNSVASNSIAPATQPYRGSTAFAGLDVNPGKVEPATATMPNTAASQANGFYGKTQPAAFSVPEMKTPQVQMPTNTVSPSGYQFGGATKTASSGQVFAMPESIHTPPQASTAQSNAAQTNAFAVPDMGAVKTRLSDNPGMSLPGELAENVTAGMADAKAAFTATADSVTAKIADVSLPNMQMSDVQMPNVQMPNVQMPNVQMGGNLGAPQIGLPEATVATGPSSYAPGSTGYSPGSTSAAKGYPSDTYVPSSSGSTYR